MKTRLSILLAAAVLPLAGCGSGGSGSGSAEGADPARLAPAAAPVFVEATVRPDGSVRDGADAALRKLLHTDDPTAKIEALLDRSGRGISYTKDIEPWLGRRVGAFASAFGGGRFTGAVIADTTDAGKAQAALAQISARETADGSATQTKRTYRGITLSVDARHGTGYAIVGGAAVVGSLDALRRVVDVSRGARPLSDVADYDAARTATGAADGLGFAYAAPQRLVDAVQASAGTGLDARTLPVLRQALARSGRAVGAALHADGSSVRLQFAALGAPAHPGANAASDAMAALPSDAWLALGIGDISRSATQGFAQLQQLAGSATQAGKSVAQLLAGFKRSTGIDLRRDLLSWMGSGGVYVRGSGLTDIGGALTLTSKSPARSHRAVGLIGRALAKHGLQVQRASVPGYDTAIQVRSGSIPIGLLIAAGGNRFSVGVNAQALTDVLKPQSRLSSAPSYAAAGKLLGDQRPVFLLDTPTIVNLLETFGLGNQPGFARVKPYLDALGPVSVGTSRDGDVSRATLALALR